MLLELFHEAVEKRPAPVEEDRAGEDGLNQLIAREGELVAEAQNVLDHSR